MNNYSNSIPLLIDCIFPGGNIIVDRVDQDTVYLYQDLRDTDAFWFYWCFRVRGGGSRILTFVFTQGDVIGTRGPAFSLDAGETWEWLGMDAVAPHPQGVSFRFIFSSDCDEVRFCFTIPYLESHLKAFTDLHTGSPHLKVDTLCRTRKGREVEVLHLGQLDGDAKHRVLLTSRHHACESIATYVLEGVMAGILQDTDAGQWLRNHVEFLIVPFMDKDGVEDGDQGKLRRPRDHNRDYEGDSLYPTTRTLRRLTPQWSQGTLRAAMDLHCPYIKGEQNEVIFFVGGPDQDNWSRVGNLCGILEKSQTRSLTYKTVDNLPFGQGWNVDSPEGKSFSRWAVDLKGIQIATSIEIPYANVRDQTVTADTARVFGCDLLRALYQFLQNMD